MNNILGESKSIEDQCLHFKIGAIPVSLQSELPEVLEDFAGIYREYRVHLPAPQQTIRMEVRSVRRPLLRRRRYRIYGDGEEIGAERQREEVFPFLEFGINSRVITTRCDYLQIHAATMVRCGKGFIFAGGSGYGKSTLAAGLLSLGWRYLSDEFALIDPATLYAHPFPKAVCVKAGAFDIIQRLGLPFARRRVYVKGMKGRVGYINPCDVGPNTVAGPTAIRFIVFPKYTEGGRPRLYPISRARALIDLTGCALNRHVYGDRAPAILAEVVRGAECFRLEAGPIDDTCKLIESLLSEPQEGAAQSEPTAKAKTCDTPASKPQHRSVSSSRRNFLRRTAKLAYVAPVVLALKPQQAFAAGSGVQSCYPGGHACPGLEPCCGELACNDGVCTNPCVEAGGLCFTDSDCCSADCDLGVCK